ncbi:helix-turn-helix transcriptional regulator [Phaeovibrio sulfidiphilus]|uniref:Helix-turn-helix transcriptional regulator n=1 Tax=Phaeovibrio sulfidiphilus TaxID=1220600 RepID=A0A8J6YZL8_9PROT|nr:helix-turn-helix transcriptional regulator [Phaeovibrio sulfidiphilus]MBE1237403.1 helix-turn-helix transcriptional regulator [Phaeovibrio sulfidiphilus]
MARRTSFDIGKDLRQWLTDRGMTQQELADAINNEKKDRKLVSQSWINRICNGHFKRTTPQVLEILGYANIPVYAERFEDPDGKLAIEKAIDDVWDGSAENARAIAKLLRSARALTPKPS